METIIIYSLLDLGCLELSRFIISLIPILPKSNKLKLVIINKPKIGVWNTLNDIINPKIETHKTRLPAYRLNVNRNLFMLITGKSEKALFKLLFSNAKKPLQALKQIVLKKLIHAMLINKDSNFSPSQSNLKLEIIAPAANSTAKNEKLGSCLLVNLIILSFI